MVKEYKKFDKIETSEFGTCHILNKNEDTYLIYSEIMRDPFLVCERKGEDLFHKVKCYYSLECAIVIYKRLGKQDRLV